MLKRTDRGSTTPARDDLKSAKLRSLRTVGHAYHTVTGNRVVALPVIRWTFVQLDANGNVITDANGVPLEVDENDINIRLAPPTNASSVTTADDDDNEDAAEIRRFFEGVLY